MYNIDSNLYATNAFYRDLVDEMQAISNYGKSSIILRRGKRAQKLRPQIVQITT